MARTASAPDISSYLDAYSVLLVEHSANPAEIRRAYKNAARKHHPDRHPAGSTEQRDATEHMSRINAAYQLVRDAPLRYHRVSTRSQPDVAWTDAELDDALRRARNERAFGNVMSGLAVAFVLFLPWLFVGVVTGSGPSSRYFWAVGIVSAGIVVLAARGGLSHRVWNLLDLFWFITRF